METLKYTTLEDIDEFLKTFDYTWTGLMKSHALTKIATKQDFQNPIQIEVYDGMFKGDNKKFLGVIVTDTTFFIEDKNLNKKFNYRDHSLHWQTFMIQRKNKDYSKYLYSIIKEEKNKKTKIYNREFNLIKTRTQQLKYEKQKEMTKLNTTLLNLETKLNKIDIKRLNNQLRKNNSNITTEQ